MEFTPDDYGLRCKFDAYCKTVLKNAARNYCRAMKRQRNREISLDTLPASKLDKLCTADHYPSDSVSFLAYGCELHIDSEDLAAAFSALPQPGQSILILHCVLELADGEIGGLLGMSRSAVQRHRTKALDILRKSMMEVSENEEV